MVKLQVFPTIIFTILLMIVISEMNVKVAEARLCESRSETFRGRCWGKTNNCGNVCRSEGFEAGRCKEVKIRALRCSKFDYWSDWSKFGVIPTSVCNFRCRLLIQDASVR
ncbi:hypothetical protein ZOSMA_335G00010 [Zostera marina]|uniref:Knottins-like domain-containing protein n=1 Tax=Zostera marina TaxID=29655 RepID=A0A0K9P815_ZOSMR|nr:hypothetical protein ZOSMA_335G00010 [Zostera marina]